MNQKLKKFLIMFIPTILVFLSDVFSKLYVLKHFTEITIKEIIPNYLNFILVYNTGAAFSIFSSPSSFNQSLKMTIVSIIAIIPLILLYRMAKPTEKCFLFALGLVAGGALGNLLDRVRLGKVVDFIDLYYKSYHWPTFNIADIAICVGVVLIVWCILRANKKIA